MWITRVLCTITIGLVINQQCVTYAQSIENSSPDAKINLDPKLRKALLRVLTDLDRENPEHETESYEEKDVVFEPNNSEQNMSEEKMILKKLIDMQQFTDDNNSSVDRSSLENNETVDRDNNINFVISKKYSPIQIEMDTAVASTTDSERRSSESNSIFSSLFQKRTHNYKNFVTAKPKENSSPAIEVTTTTTLPSITTEINDFSAEGKVEEVQFFSAPLVAAFTVHQDERGLPRSVVPLYKNEQQVNNQHKRDQQNNLINRIPNRNNNIEIRPSQQIVPSNNFVNFNNVNNEVRNSQMPIVMPHNFASNEIHNNQPPTLNNFVSNEVRNHQQQPNQLNTNFVAPSVSVNNDFRSSQPINFNNNQFIPSNPGKTVNNPVDIHAALIEKQRILEEQLNQLRQEQQRQQQLVIQTRQKQQEFEQQRRLLQQQEEQLRIKQLRIQEEEQKRQQQLRAQEENIRKQQQAARENIRSNGNFLLQSSIGGLQPPLLFQQLPNREAVDFLASLRQHELPLQQNHIPLNFNDALPPLQQINAPPPPIFSTSPIITLTPTSGRNSNRVFRQEPHTANFGLNIIPTSSFTPRPSFNSADRQLKNLLYQSGIISNGGQEDLNIVSKVLSLNHFGGDFSGILRRSGNIDTFYFNNN